MNYPVTPSRFPPGDSYWIAEWLPTWTAQDSDYFVPFVPEGSELKWLGKEVSIVVCGQMASGETERIFRCEPIYRHCVFRRVSSAKMPR